MQPSDKHESRSSLQYKRKPKQVIVEFDSILLRFWFNHGFSMSHHHRNVEMQRVLQRASFKGNTAVDGAQSQLSEALTSFGALSVAGSAASMRAASITLPITSDILDSVIQSARGVGSWKSGLLSGRPWGPDFPSGRSKGFMQRLNEAIIHCSGFASTHLQLLLLRQCSRHKAQPPRVAKFAQRCLSERRIARAECLLAPSQTELPAYPGLRPAQQRTVVSRIAQNRQSQSPR